MIEHAFEDIGPLAARDVPTVAAAVRTLGRGDSEACELVSQIARLEELKGAVAAAQARAAAAFAVKERAEKRAAGVRGRMGHTAAAQVALARRESPHRGSRHLGLAEALVNELPHTLAALDEGQISEWRATPIVRERMRFSFYRPGSEPHVRPWLDQHRTANRLCRTASSEGS